MNGLRDDSLSSEQVAVHHSVVRSDTHLGLFAESTDLQRRLLDRYDRRTGAYHGGINS